MSRRRGGNSDTCKWLHCICMCSVLCMCVSTSQPCGSHTRHLHSSSRDPRNNHSVFQSSLSFFFLSLSEASMVSGRQVISLSVQIMTVIKQLRPERQRGQELAFPFTSKQTANEDSPGISNTVAVAYACSLWY